MDIIQGSFLGSMVFALLLLFKQSAQKRCGARIWNFFMIVSITTYMLPIFFPRLSLPSAVKSIHVWFQNHFFLLADFQNKNISVEILPSEMLYNILFCVWLAGMIVYLTIRCLINTSYIRWLRNGFKSVPLNVVNVFNDQFLSDKKLNRFGKLQHVKLHLHAKISSPVVYGFFIKKIVLPEKTINNYCPEDISLILRHEVIHIAHHDSWKHLFLLFVQAINWFNPILFLLERELNEALEIYCDHESIIDKSDANARYQYSDLLLSTIEMNHRQSVVGFSITNSKTMEKRVTFAMLQPRKPAKFLAFFIGFLICIIVFICSMAFYLPSEYAQNDIFEGVVDTGEISYIEHAVSEEKKDYGYNLSEQGELAVELPLYSGKVNMIPTALSTFSSEISVSVLTRGYSMLVYIYYSENENYPLMQMKLERYSMPQTFSGLSGKRTYILGIIVDQDVNEPIQLLISD